MIKAGLCFIVIAYLATVLGCSPPKSRLIGKWYKNNEEYCEFFDDNTVLFKGKIPISGKWKELDGGRIKIDCSVLGTTTIFLGNIDDSKLILNVTNTEVALYKQISPSAIRNVDFTNFTYDANLCNQEYGKDGIGSAVQVHNGEFKNNQVYYDVVSNKIIYGDLTGDGIEEAVVENCCGYHGANFSLSEIFIFTSKGGEAVLLANLNTNDVKRDYFRYYPNPNGFFWGITETKIVGGTLIVQGNADGCHATPEYVVTFQYRWNGKQLVLDTQPQKKAYIQ